MAYSLPQINTTISNNMGSVNFNLDAFSKTSANLGNLTNAELQNAYKRAVDQYSRLADVLRFVWDAVKWLISYSNVFSDMDLNELYLKIQTDVRAQIGGLKVDIAQGSNSQFLALGGYIQDLSWQLDVAGDSIKSRMARDAAETKATIVQSLSGVSASVSGATQKTTSDVIAALQTAAGLIRSDVSQAAEKSRESMDAVTRSVVTAAQEIKNDIDLGLIHTREVVLSALQNMRKTVQDAFDDALKPIEARLLNLGDDVAYRVFIYFRDFFFQQVQ